MTNQTRHFQPKEENLIYDYGNDLMILNTVLGNIEHPSGVSSLNYYALSTAIRSVLLNKSKEEILENFQRLAEMGVFTFKMNQSGTGTFKSTVCGKEYEFQGEQEGSYITATDWLLYLQCATIANDKQSMDYLLSLTYEVFALSSVSHDALDQLIVLCFKAIYQDFENENEVLELIRLTEEKGKVYGSSFTFFNDYVIPVLSVYRAFYSKQDALIDEVLENTISKHIKYWSTEEQKYDTRGWISIPLISALIHKKFKTSVKSEYLPDNIIP